MDNYYFFHFLALIILLLLFLFLKLRAQWDAPIPTCRLHPSRMYDIRHVCLFCSQFFEDQDNLEKRQEIHKNNDPIYEPISQEDTFCEIPELQHQEMRVKLAQIVLKNIGDNLHKTKKESVSRRALEDLPPRETTQNGSTEKNTSDTKCQVMQSLTTKMEDADTELSPKDCTLQLHDSSSFYSNLTTPSSSFYTSFSASPLHNRADSCISIPASHTEVAEPIRSSSISPHTNPKHLQRTTLYIHDNFRRPVSAPLQKAHPIESHMQTKSHNKNFAHWRQEKQDNKEILGDIQSEKELNQKNGEL